MLSTVALSELHRRSHPYSKSTQSGCGQNCFVLCGLISAAQRNFDEAEPDSNETTLKVCLNKKHLIHNIHSVHAVRHASISNHSYTESFICGHMYLVNH